MDDAAARDTLRALRRAAILLAVIIIAAATVVLVSLHNAQIAGCDRGKVNSGVQARQARSRVVYLDRVLVASSVKDDVKRAASAQRVEELTAVRLFEQRSHIDCGDAYPLVSI